MRTKFLTLLAVISFFPFISSGQMEHKYLGLHYEYGATINMRYGRINGQKGHFFLDAAIPRLITSLAGWRVEGDKVKPVLQGRYMSMRGGKHFKTGEQSSLGFDICWEFMGIAAPPDSGKTTTFTGHLCMPLAIGIAYTKSFGDNFSFVLIPFIGYALAKTKTKNEKNHMRYAGDIYLQYNFADNFTIYAGTGYGYYPKGLPMTWPQDASFGGPLFSAGLALPVSF